MGQQGRTFSESWHRVAELKVGIRPNLNLKKQFFRGEEWYVLHDPFNNQFFRFRPKAYEFISRLSPGVTIEEVWKKCMEIDPDGAPGQEDVIRLLSQLYNSNLLYFSSRPDTSKIFERYSRRRRQEIKSTLMSIMFIRLPLFDPNRILGVFMPVFKKVISPVGAFVWLFVVAMAIKQGVDNWGQLWNHAQSMLAPGNLFYLYLSLVIVKIFHEIGHSAVCKRFGGEVHTLGLMFLIFTPLPYMDATSSWQFRNRFKRVFVSAAGIIVEIFMAAIACIIWSHTGEGLIHSVAYNIMFIASVSTLLFNANPLLRFDGYYILSDLMDTPNLHTRANKEVIYFIEKYIFNCKDSVSDVSTKNEKVFLLVFWVLSHIYRVLVFAGIAFFIADKLLILGLILVLVCIVTWVFVPFFKLINYLFTSPSIARNRGRAIFVSFAFLIGLAGVFFLVSFPRSFDSPGVIEASGAVKIYCEEPGILKGISVKSGEKIKKGDILFKIENKELEFDLESAGSQLEELRAIISQARHESIADIAPLKKQEQAVKARIKDLRERKKMLVVAADSDGIWYAPDLKKLLNCWVGKGVYIGNIIDTRSYIFKAVVLQNQSGDLFEGEKKNPLVKIKGQAENEIRVGDYSIIPFESSKLPSLALGWRAGGEIATSFSDETGLTTIEPFFLIKARLKASDDVSFIHGRTGKIHFTLSPKSLYYQASQKVKQVLQKRYKI